jgi:hypothetical protein
MLLQFRAFISHGWAKQFLHNVHMRDFSTFTTFAYGMMAGAAVYMVQEQLKASRPTGSRRSTFRSVSRRRRSRQLPSRAGWSSFIPTMVDSAIAVRRQADLRHAHVGAAVGPWFGNPGTGLIDDTSKMLKGLVQADHRGSPTYGRGHAQPRPPAHLAERFARDVLMNFLTRGMPDRSPRQAHSHRITFKGAPQSRGAFRFSARANVLLLKSLLYGDGAPRRSASPSAYHRQGARHRDGQRRGRDYRKLAVVLSGHALPRAG